MALASCTPAPPKNKKHLIFPNGPTIARHLGQYAYNFETIAFLFSANHSLIYMKKPFIKNTYQTILVEKQEFLLPGKEASIFVCSFYDKFEHLLLMQLKNVYWFTTISKPKKMCYVSSNQEFQLASVKVQINAKSNVYFEFLEKHLICSSLRRDSFQKNYVSGTCAFIETLLISCGSSNNRHMHVAHLCFLKGL